eukprot:353529-Chlamydomonas_euryale.AAC.11
MSLAAPRKESRSGARGNGRVGLRAACSSARRALDAAAARLCLPPLLSDPSSENPLLVACAPAAASANSTSAAQRMVCARGEARMDGGLCGDAPSACTAMFTSCTSWPTCTPWLTARGPEACIPARVCVSVVRVRVSCARASPRCTCTSVVCVHGARACACACPLCVSVVRVRAPHRHACLHMLVLMGG